jgi:phosphoserine phosphatase
MSKKILTVVSKNNFTEDECTLFFKESFNLKIDSSVSLSETAIQMILDGYDDQKTSHIKKILESKKVDFCFKNSADQKHKALLCDMDATIIENETLDDLVKITGTKTNVDQTSKLAMEGKIDLRTTLKTRVDLLKGHPISLIDKVLKGIKFNSGGDTLVKTLNSMGYVTSLITGGFKPISSFVGDKLGFQNVISNEFEFDNNNCFTGNYIPITGEKNSKFKYMERLSKEKNISFSEMVAIGDGSNDLEMLKHAGFGIGYHAHDIIKNNIERQIIFNDLTTVLYFLGIKKSDFIN